MHEQCGASLKQIKIYLVEICLWALNIANYIPFQGVGCWLIWVSCTAQLFICRISVSF